MVQQSICYKQSQQDVILDNDTHLRDYLNILVKRKRIAGTFFLVILIAVLLLTLAQTPMYQASTQVLIEKSKAVQLSNPYGIPQFDPHFLVTQFELIKSKNVLYRVVKTLKLDSDYREYFIKEPSAFFAVPLIGKWGKAIITGVTPRKVVAPGVVAELKDTEKITNSDRIADFISEQLYVAPIRDTNVVSIAYFDKNPVFARMIVNEVARSYMAELLEIKMQTTSYTISWMTKKAEEEKQKLQDVERALQHYTREHDIVTVEDKVAVTPQQLVEYSAQMSKAKARRNELEDIYNQIQKVGKEYSAIENLSVFANNSNLQQINEKILETGQKISELSKKLGGKHPSMIKSREELGLLHGEKNTLIQRFIESMKNEYELAKQAEANIEQLLEETKAKTLNLNEKLIQYNILKREVDSGRILYESLIKQIKERNATEQTQTVDVFIIEKAKTPEKPVTPKKLRSVMLAITLSCIGGLGMAFFVDYLDNTVNSAEDLEVRFNMPVLGVVELMKDEGVALSEILRQRPNTAFAESFRMIRSSVMLSSSKETPRKILITSSVQGEGKSSVCLNLAQTIAKDGKSVIVLDCDLRRPTQHKLLNIDNRIGMSTYLAGLSKENVIVSIPDYNISVIPSGPLPPDPAELLGSAKMYRILEVLSRNYEFILIDSAPILSVTDSHVLSTMVDATMLVTQANKTTYDLVKASVKLLKKLNAHLLGSVLNAKVMKKKGYAAYNYGEYYTDDYLSPSSRSDQNKFS